MSLEYRAGQIVYAVVRPQKHPGEIQFSGIIMARLVESRTPALRTQLFMPNDELESYRSITSDLSHAVVTTFQGWADLVLEFEHPAYCVAEQEFQPLISRAVVGFGSKISEAGTILLL